MIVTEVAPSGVTEVTELENDPRVKDLLQDVQTKLEGYTRQYEKKYKELSERPTSAVGLEIAEPITPLPVPYLWFDLMALGPFQPIAPGGPLLPNRVIRVGEPAFLVAALWRNPVPLLGGPSAAAVMSPFTFVVRGQTVNLNTVASGPDLGPASGVFGPGFVNLLVLPIPAVPPPPQGEPLLLEIHLSVDVVGPGPGLPPFAGFATRWFQPDLQPPFLGQPGILPGVLEETPVRFLIYS